MDDVSGPDHERRRGNSAPPRDATSDDTFQVFTPRVLLFLGLPLALLLTFGFVIPMLDALLGALASDSGTETAFQSVLQDDVFWRVLLRTLVTALVVSIATLLLAYPTAEFMVRASPRIRPLLLGIVVVPLWSSVIARTYGWVGVFVRDGLVDRIASLFDVGPLQLLYSQFAVWVGMVHVLLPIMILPIYAALLRLDDRLTHASLSLGAGFLRTILHVRFPAVSPAVVGATTAVYVLTLGFYVTPALLGGPTSMLISNLVGQQVFQRFDLERAQGMSVALLVAALTVIALCSSVLRYLRRRLA